MKNAGWLYPLSAFDPCNSSLLVYSALGYIHQSTKLIEMSDNCQGANLTNWAGVGMTGKNCCCFKVEGCISLFEMVEEDNGVLNRNTFDQRNCAYLKRFWVVRDVKYESGAEVKEDMLTQVVGMPNRFHTSMDIFPFPWYGEPNTLTHSSDIIPSPLCCQLNWTISLFQGW